ncbi:MAG TPA: endonuclease/exonuclease/phosphatase family protein [Candidatus Polarisedimenticolia bacterium]|nr:endonuclease/exonuclease/phosphatase family protein [Candidatus Polarisedimenticolia bacterium]
MNRLTLGAAILLLFTVGQTLKDRTLVSALVFYVLAPPFVTAALLVAGFWPGWRKRSAAACLVASFALVPLGVSAFLDHRLASRVAPGVQAGGDRGGAAPGGAAAGRPLRIVAWNVAFVPFGAGPLAYRLRPYDPDLLLLTEFQSWYAPRLASALGSDRTARPMETMCLIARGVIEGARWVEADDRLQIFVADWSVPGGAGAGATLRVMGVNMVSSPLVKRDPLLRRVLAAMASEQPDLVLGDFNSPRRSRALDPLPEGFTHAYDAAGRGWAYSWPVPLPVLAIDQTIVGARLEPLAYALHSTIVSDHRMQVLDFRLR